MIWATCVFRSYNLTAWVSCRLKTSFLNIASIDILEGSSYMPSEFHILKGHIIHKNTWHDLSSPNTSSGLHAVNQKINQFLLSPKRFSGKESFHLTAITNVLEKQQDDNGSCFDKEWAQVGVNEVNDVVSIRAKQLSTLNLGSGENITCVCLHKVLMEH